MMKYNENISKSTPIDFSALILLLPKSMKALDKNERANYCQSVF